MFRQWLDYLTVLRSGYFDPAYYLLTYRDCRLADVDPVFHFVSQGWREGRNPSPIFDTKFYLRANPDVKQAGLNPLVHYLKHGQYEGRAPQPFQTHQRPSRRVQRRERGPLYALGKKIYWRIPSKTRQKLLAWSYRNLGFLFAGMPHYENWRNSRNNIQVTTQSNLIDLNTVEAAQEVTGKIAIHLHVFYPDLVKEFAGYLKNMPFAYDLFVSAASDEALTACQQGFGHLPHCQGVNLQRVPNRGRDIAPFFCTFGQELVQYDYIAHLHTKKSLYNKGATEGWREYLCKSLLGDEDRIRRIFSLLQGEDAYGIVYPQNYLLLPYWANTWLANRGLAAAWAARLGLGELPRGYFDYPASSMFWVRGPALAPLFHAGLTLEDFPEERGQTDGTLAHTLERLFVLCTRKQGLAPAILQDEENPSWSPWRFDQYTQRSYAELVQMLHAPEIRVIAFDIFDTLFCRPLLDPESIKALVARRAGGEAGALYEEYRALAEGQAREAKGSDVGLDEIYARLSELTNLSGDYLKELRRLEEETEQASLEPREDAVTLFKDALATGKPVILLSDMFLPRRTLEAALHLHALGGWKGLFVSNEVGLRKDTGRLYEHVLKHFDLQPAHMLMIGDNERVDIQIPTDMGMPTLHLLRPVELARALPRFSSLIALHEQRHDLDAEITLGLVVRKNFASLHFPTFDPNSLVPATPYHIGYSFIGPVIVSFSQWVLQQARQDGLTRLYFLSREGKPIKEIYDCWTEGEPDAPRSEYLVASRRAAGLAAIASLDDILNIAKTTFFPNRLDGFLHTRYGIHLNETRWQELAQALSMTPDTIISVQDKKIDHLVPLLKAVEGEIMARVQLERRALLAYLDSKGLSLDDQQAVVDVGYGGSVQGYLNQLLRRKVHGYYLMTDERAQKVANAHQVLLRGCFFDNVQLSSNMPVMYRYSFDVEKLLSTNEPQIEYYEQDATGQVMGHSRALLPEELACADLRNQILAGALDFARDARRVRATLLPDFHPSRWTAQLLFEAFLGQKSQQEANLMSQIVLDDHYCGRGLVS
ncbi:MAG: hypothetical protein Fur0022_14750 [Anaerolineales bacterium]